MVSGKHKSRTYRRVKVKLTTSVTVHYRKRKPKLASCGSCKKPLKGVARGRPYKIKKMNKTQRRPKRPYGGVLCSKCMREKIKEQLR